MKRLNIFAAVANWNWERVHLIESLISMGHSVTWFDWKADKYDQYSSDWESVKKKEMNDILLDKVSKAHAENKIDVFFGYLSDPVIDSEYIAEIRSWQIPTINFGCNDINSFERGHLKTCSYYTLNWTTNKVAIPKYEELGAKCIYTPYGINPIAYAVRDKKNEMPKKAFDFSFVGQPYGYRMSFMIGLICKGLSYGIFGKVSFKRFIRTVLESRVCVGFSGLGGNTFDNKEMKQLRLRDFEITGLGGLYLTERCDFIQELFEEDKEILYYDTYEEFLDKAVFYTRYKNRKIREIIAKAGREKCLNEYTWDNHFTKVFKEIGVI